jgi:hypothetical protein
MDKFAKECMELHRSIEETKIEIIEHRISLNQSVIEPEDLDRHLEIIREYGRGNK